MMALNAFLQMVFQLGGTEIHCSDLKLYTVKTLVKL